MSPDDNKRAMKELEVMEDLRIGLSRFLTYWPDYHAVLLSQDPDAFSPRDDRGENTLEELLLFRGYARTLRRTLTNAIKESKSIIEKGRRS
jgi:hypothetical protein